MKKTLMQAVSFFFVGLSGLVVDMTVVFITKLVFNLPTIFTGIVGFSFALSNNFLWNYKFTFKNSRSINSKRKSYVLYIVTCCIGLVVRLSIMTVLIKYSSLESWSHGYLIINFIGIVGATSINFIGSKKFAFR